MKRKILQGGFFLAVVALAITGCADKTTQQYDEQQADLNAAQLAAVAGTYNGTITALEGGATIGGIQISLTPGQALVSSPDGTTTTTQANLTGTVKIIGVTTSEAPFTGTYEPDINQVAGLITINSNLQLNLLATVSGSTLSGKIEANQYADDGGQFTATVGGTLPTVQGSSAGQAPENHVTSYAGASGDPSACSLEGKSCQVTMTVNDTPNSSVDAFADALVPDVNTVNVVAVITTTDPTTGGPVPTSYYFSAAEEDDRAGTILGNGPGPEGVGTVTLNCVGSPTSGWSCDIPDGTFRVGPSAAAVK